MFAPKDFIRFLPKGQGATNMCSSVQSVGVIFPCFISLDSGASDCAVPVVIYFGEPCGKSRIGVDKIDLIRFCESLGEQELHTSLRAYPCHPWESFLHRSARCVVTSAIVVNREKWELF